MYSDIKLYQIEKKVKVKMIHNITDRIIQTVT